MYTYYNQRSQIFSTARLILRRNARDYFTVERVAAEIVGGSLECGGAPRARFLVLETGNSGLFYVHLFHGSIKKGKHH